MYNQMFGAFTSISPMLIDSQLAKLAFVTKSVIPKAKVIVLETTENKNAQIIKVFSSHLNISSVPISHQQSEIQQLGTTHLSKPTLKKNHSTSVENSRQEYQQLSVNSYQ
ncbi:MAG: DUF4347 domain-containing protein [Iphinoe sp. HA4291-MV1]|jgi:hypothetical protein|nr:DUF4347 domain-containing protein [Iphinoe sp. HA4291-MV1]